LKACLRIKELEATINHDIKAVEYYIKEQFASNPVLNPLKEWVHFGLTSQGCGCVQCSGAKLSAALRYQQHRYSNAIG
jgi:hypothetical protein